MLSYLFVKTSDKVIRTSSQNQWIKAIESRKWRVFAALEEEHPGLLERRRLTNVIGSLISMLSKSKKQVFHGELGGCVKVLWPNECQLLSGVYIAPILRPNTSCALLDIRSLPLWSVNRWAAAIVSGDLRFQATAAVTSTGKSTGRESLGLNASGSERQIGQGVCAFDGDHKQWPVWGLQNHYIYINPWVLVWGIHWDALLRLRTFGIRSQSLDHIHSPNVNLWWSAISRIRHKRDKGLRRKEKKLMCC